MTAFPEWVRQRARGVLQLMDRTPVAHLVFDSLLDGAPDEPEARTLRFRSRGRRELSVSIHVAPQPAGLEARLQIEPPRRYVIDVRHVDASRLCARSDDTGRAKIAGLPGGLMSFAVAAPDEDERAHRTAWVLY